ncbi:TlpA disulfide reductase family protein [Rhodanobacter sp. AS-Z3]|uniref:TlpA family protein disulfide reductase n=1 Tax=Rhodanobacter sp. AS-Z3 TaxID=3031330 RepID=UPI00247A5B56|nr:TlpA disulfide reductase family protein [Rhodanobacter sp. AS-Z3]WEN16377.1 TlpA disulfide reductase family protein [Rhodanobacter sp. AS-Z3]
MTLLRSPFFRSAVIGLTFAFGVSAQAAMPEQPSLHVTTLDGKTFDLSAQRGKWVIVNYWATWCVPCIKEMPDISRFVASHKNVVGIGLAYDDSEAADIKDFLVKHPVVYPIAQVSMENPPKDFDEPRGLPTTYLISPDGKVAKHIVGPVTEASLADMIGAK